MHDHLAPQIRQADPAGRPEYRQRGLSLRRRRVHPAGERTVDSRHFLLGRRSRRPAAPPVRRRPRSPKRATTVDASTTKGSRIAQHHLLRPKTARSRLEARTFPRGTVTEQKHGAGDRRPRVSELIQSVCARAHGRALEGRGSRPLRGVRAPVLPLGAARGSRRPEPPTSTAPRSPTGTWRASAPGRGEGPRLQPGPRAGRLASPHTVVEIVTDDMPFLVDSVTMELDRQGYGIDLVIHPVMRVRRDADGQLIEVLEPDATPPATRSGVDPPRRGRRASATPSALRATCRRVARVLGDVAAPSQDWGAMRSAAERRSRRARATPAADRRGEIERGKAFLDWLADDHFTFLGYREYELVERRRRERAEGRRRLRPRDPARRRRRRRFTPLGRRRCELARAPAPARAHQGELALDRAPPRVPRLHRGQALRRPTAGHRRAALPRPVHDRARTSESPLRDPAAARQGRSGAGARRRSRPTATTRKALLEILETYPRDSLFQIDDRRAVRDRDGHPRARRAPAPAAVRAPRTRSTVSSPAWSASRAIASTREPRADRTDPLRGVRRQPRRLDAAAVASRCSCACTTSSTARRGRPDDTTSRSSRRRLRRGDRGWTDDLREALIEELGEERGARSTSATSARSRPPTATTGRRARRSPTSRRLEELLADRRPDHQPLPPARGRRRRRSAASSSAPARRALRRAADVRAHGRRGRRRAPLRDHARGRRSRCGSTTSACAAPPSDLERVRDAVPGGVPRRVARRARGRRPQRARARGRAHRPRDHDRARGRASTCARPGSRSRTPTWSARCIATPRSRAAGAAVRRPLRPRRPDDELRRSAQAGAIEDGDRRGRSLDEDRILRSFLTVVLATLRTNYFRTDATGGEPRAASCRSSSTPTEIPLLPLPRPQFEIFVYSPRVEGVHLRGGKVARGGLRWSDRREDFRTEVLGLMKAQMVKNALIVPVGSKGGFVVKRPPAEGGREALLDGGDRLLPDVPRRPARPHRQHRRRRGASRADRRWCATTRTTRTSSSPPTRARRRSPTSPTASRPTTASGSATRSPRAARRATTTRRWASPPAAPGSRSSATSASSAPTSRRPTSPSSGSATCRATCSATACCSRATSGWSPRSTTARVPRPGPRSRAPASPSASGCSSCRARRGATTTRRLISEGGGVYPRTAKSIPISAAGQGGAGDRGRASSRPPS